MELREVPSEQLRDDDGLLPEPGTVVTLDGARWEVVMTSLQSVYLVPRR